jgi:amino acid adenylation domain-containing protein
MSIIVNINTAELIRPNPEWNATDTKFPADLCIHELFEQQVAKTPDSTALVDGDKQFTYAQINIRANRLARLLRQRGVTNEKIVGCHLKRSSAIVVFTLAIMKTGGTYILLDANMPKPRLEYMISDAQPILIITDSQLPVLSVGYAMSVSTVSELESAADIQDDANIAASFPSSSVAYIAYTSGSTGQPKGVMITHQATVNHACAFSHLFKLSSSDRVPLMAPIAFDMAIEEMIPPLISGCTLVVSRSKFISMDGLTREIIQNSYTILNIPAPLWHEWTEYLEANELQLPPQIRLVITGSEEISTKSFQSWKQLPGADKVHWAAAYGTTETTVTSTFYTSASTDDLTDEPFVPIGKPIANTYIYILNEKRQQVAVGEEGELFIGGQGLARGYLHREELTKEKFISDPFQQESGARMYKTGDLARYRPDGTVVWLGRNDTQFKRYGLRIEPAEIEAILNQSPSVQQSAVVLQRMGEREADKRLVAFIVLEPGLHMNTIELQQLAYRSLPTLMIPDSYVCLPSLPINSNGKIDHKALENYPVTSSELH